MSSERFAYDTIVIGGGQAGLVTGYYLKQHSHDFVILDASERIGDAWRNRWDSLRLFTPTRFNHLPGMPYPAPNFSFPTKDEYADFLATYASHFELPVRSGVKVDHLTKEGDKFILKANNQRYEANNVVIAMANYQRPRIPDFADQLDPSIVQFHSIEYRNPSQLQDGDVLIVGAGNSGAEVAIEIIRSHRTWLSGKHPGQIPFRIDGLAARLILHRIIGFVGKYVLTIRTPIGRKLRQKILRETGPLVRVKLKDLTDAGVQHVPRTTGVKDGLPVLEDGRVLDVANVIWCTGFHPGFSWIDLPIIGEAQEPLHERGIVHKVPGIYFVGLHFQYAITSATVFGVGHDAKYVVEAITSRKHEIRTGSQVQAEPA